MELQSSRRLRVERPSSLPQNGALPQQQQVPSGEENRISDLPEGIIHDILNRLGCAKAAARTSVLSREWRQLWTSLPPVTIAFHDVQIGSLPAALARAACSGVHLVDIFVPQDEDEDDDEEGEHGEYTASISSALLAAASLYPVELWFNYRGNVVINSDVDLPLFHRATSIELKDWDYIYFMLPPAGGFPALERFSFSGCHVDVPTLIRICPRLRVLTIRKGLHLHMSDIVIHSPVLEELVVSGFIAERIDIRAAKLKKLEIDLECGEYLNISFWAPILEHVSWSWEHYSCVQIHDIWFLRNLCLQTLTNHDKMLTLELEDRHYVDLPDVVLDYAQEMVKHLLVSDFSVLRVNLKTREHVFGPALLHLLGITWIRTAIRTLYVSIGLGSEAEKTCLCNDPGPNNLRTQTISLIHLEEVEIDILGQYDQEFDFLELIFRSARMLKTMRVWLKDEVWSSNDGRMKVQNIFDLYPSVDCCFIDQKAGSGLVLK